MAPMGETPTSLGSKTQIETILTYARFGIQKAPSLEGWRGSQEEPD